MESTRLNLSYTHIVRVHFNSCEPLFAYLEEAPQASIPVLKSTLLGLIFVLAVFGLFGNSFTIILLLRKRVSFSQLNPLFIGLSISDVSVCLHEIIAVILPQFLLSAGVSFGFSKENVISILDFQMMTLYSWLTSCSCSLYFIVAISLERFIAVYWPLKANTMLPFKRTKRIAIIIPFFSGVVNISLFIYIIRKQILGQWICFLTPYYKVLIIIFWLSIPTIFIVIPNCFIIKALFHRQKQLKELTRQELKTIHTTKMIVCIVTVYLLNTCAGAAHVLIIEDSVINYNIMNLLMSLNSSINYVIYCMFGKTFRESLTKLFCKSYVKEYSGGDLQSLRLSYARSSCLQSA